MVLLGSIALSGLFVIAATSGGLQRQGRGRLTQNEGNSAQANVPSDSGLEVWTITYRVATRMRSPVELILEISVEPENFTRDKMFLLARQLNKDFPNESRIYAVIFDSESAARNYNPAGGTYSISKKLERGEYFLDRVKGRESINFSTRRGNPVDEIKVSINDNVNPINMRRRSARRPKRS
jgi:hypothetical protein